MSMTMSLLLRLPNNLRHRMLGQVDFINGGASILGLISFCYVFFTLFKELKQGCHLHRVSLG